MTVKLDDLFEVNIKVVNRTGYYFQWKGRAASGKAAKRTAKATYASIREVLGIDLPTGKIEYVATKQFEPAAHRQVFKLAEIDASYGRDAALERAFPEISTYQARKLAMDAISYGSPIHLREATGGSGLIWDVDWNRGRGSPLATITLVGHQDVATSMRPGALDALLVIALRCEPPKSNAQRYDKAEAPRHQKRTFSTTADIVPTSATLRAAASAASRQRASRAGKRLARFLDRMGHHDLAARIRAQDEEPAKARDTRRTKRGEGRASV